MYSSDREKRKREYHHHKWVTDKGARRRLVCIDGIRKANYDFAWLNHLDDVISQEQWSVFSAL